MNRGRLLVSFALAMGFVWTLPAAAAGPGESIYRRGLLESGQAVTASRSDTTRLQGAATACINCHRRSGLGSKEGRSLVPPITGRYLFHPRGGRDQDLDLPFVEGARADREPYTDETLARAITEGLDSQGKPLSYLMPRFELNSADMGALVAYLKRLDQRRVPGVSDTVLHFATIITPDADPLKRRGMLDVLEHYFTDRNATQPGPTARLMPSGKTNFSKMMFKVNRRWELHVWELTGSESTWQVQLEQRLAAQPVFAVISGLAGKTWAPVHNFCERAALPCLFPNVEVPPVDADRDFYSLYFTKGVLLEAELIGKKILDGDSGPATRRVRQVFRSGDSGEAAAQALAAQLKAHGIAVASHAIALSAPADAVAAALRNTPDGETVVLWLRASDVAALEGVAQVPGVVYLSGRMGGLDRAPLPAAWREHTHMAYPVDLPERRRVRVDYALGWFAIRHIPVVADQVQVDTYLACGLLSETLKHMVDTFVRDYLVERVEDTLEHRVVTGYYPRLSLSSQQRFASKGGYITRFAALQGQAVAAEGEWTVP